MASRVRFTTLLVESYRNTVAHGWLSFVCATVAALSAFAVTAGTVSSSRDLSSVLQSQSILGANAFVVTSPTSARMRATDCEALRNVAGVNAAGAHIATRTVLPASLPGIPITVWDVTPGFVQFAFPGESSQALPGLWFGSELASAVGARPGAMLSVDEERRQVLLVSGVSEVSTERVRGSSTAALAPLVGDIPITACFVESSPAHRRAVELMLATWFGPMRQWAVTPLVPPGHFEIDVQNSIRTGPMIWISPALGLVTILVAASLWWSRRHEFALYALLGFRLGRVLALLALEATATLLVPVLGGSLAAVAAVGVDGVAGVLWPSTVALAGAHFLVVLTAPAVGFAIVSATPPIDLLKGA